MITVAEIWRYPVKSLHGESLDHATIDHTGLVGDRLIHVRDDGGVVTGRSRGRLLPIRATTTSDGRVLVEGHPWDGAATAALIRGAAGTDARLDRYAGPERFDVLPLLIATDAEVERLGVDRRRLRPNLLLSGTAPFEERGWPGMALHIGSDLVVGVDSVRLRCVVTTVDPDTGDPDRDVLRRIHREFESRVALNCWVIRPGQVTPGDPVKVLPLPTGTPDPYAGRPASWITGGTYPG